MKKIFLFALCAILATSCVFTTSGGSFNIGSCTEKISDKTFIDTVYTDVQALRVVQTPLPIRIEASGSDTLSVKCYVEKMNTNDPEYRIAARMTGSTLEIYQEPREGLSFNNVSGYIDIRVQAEVKDIEGKTISGGVTAYLGEKTKKVSFGTVSGGIRLFLKGDLKDNRYTLSGVSGGARVDGVGSGRRKFSFDGGKNLADVRAKTVSGGITVRNW